MREITEFDTANPFILLNRTLEEGLLVNPDLFSL